MGYTDHPTPFEYEGFVLTPEFQAGRLIGSSCSEIGFQMKGNYISDMIGRFTDMVDKVLANKPVVHADVEKELNRLRLLLFMQPEVFYGTRQVFDLLTLAEGLLAASKPKEEPEDPNWLEYRKQLDWLADWANRLKPPALTIRQKLIEIHILFDKILDLSFEDVKREYFKRANKGENNDSAES